MGSEGAGAAVITDGFMHGTVFELCGATLKEPQFGVRVEAAVTNPAAEEEVLSRHEVGIVLRLAGKQRFDLHAEPGADLFVCVQGENPIAGAFCQGRVFLRGEALPLFHENLCAVLLRDGNGVVGGAGVDHNHLTGPCDRGESARKVGFLVAGDDGDGEFHRRMGGLSACW